MNTPSRNFTRWTAFGLAIAAAVTITTTDSHGRAVDKENKLAATRPSDPLVEEADKNIKVLMGMPESQLIPAMKFMSVSLGVGCNYCHVSKDGQLDTAAD